MRYTRSLLRKLEKQVTQRYQLRYGVGNFQHGVCQLREKQVLVINRFMRLETKIDILQRFVEMSPDQSEAN